MKSAIDEIVFLGLWLRVSLRQAIVDLIQRQTAPATLAIKYLIGEIIFLTPVSALPDGGGEQGVCCVVFPEPVRRGPGQS